VSEKFREHWSLLGLLMSSLDQKGFLVLAKELLVMDNAEMLVALFGQQ